MAQTATTFDDEHFRREIRNRLIQHQKWLASEDDGARGDLRNLDLYQWRLPNIVLSRADLRATCFARADLRGANLSGATLLLADLEEADLTGADLRGADLRGARLNGAKLNAARMDGVDLGPCGLKGPVKTTRHALEGGRHIATMREAELQGAVLVNANLQCCDLSGSDMTGANLSGADLANAVLEDVAFDEDASVLANMPQSVSFQTVSFNILNAVDQHELFLRSRGLKGAQLDVKGKTIEKAELRMRDLRQARFIDCQLIGVNFAECDLSQSDFSGSTLDACSFADATLHAVAFRRTSMRTVAFNRADISGMGFHDSSGGVQTSFEGARLQDCEFDKASVAQALFRNTSATATTLLELQKSGVPPMVLRRLTVIN